MRSSSSRGRHSLNIITHGGKRKGEKKKKESQTMKVTIPPTLFSSFSCLTMYFFLLLVVTYDSRLMEGDHLLSFYERGVVVVVGYIQSPHSITIHLTFLVGIV